MIRIQLEVFGTNFTSGNRLKDIIAFSSLYMYLNCHYIVNSVAN